MPAPGAHRHAQSEAVARKTPSASFATRAPLVKNSGWVAIRRPQKAASRTSRTSAIDESQGDPDRCRREEQVDESQAADRRSQVGDAAEQR